LAPQWQPVEHETAPPAGAARPIRIRHKPHSAFAVTFVMAEPILKPAATVVQGGPQRLETALTALLAAQMALLAEVF
jgi:hypothetical protein